MIAPRDLKDPACIRKSALLNVLDPGPIHSHRNLVFSLACHRAGVTPDALAVINYKAVFHPTESSNPSTSIIRGLPMGAVISQ